MEKLVQAEISQGTAAELMNISERQVRRKLARYRENGAQGLVHRSRGKSSNNKTDETISKRIIELACDKYSNYGPTFMAEKLEENEHIQIHHETLRLMLIANGLHAIRRKRRKHRKWREPKEHLGQMLQLDGSPHLWIEGGSVYWTLIKFIDDATKRTYARFYLSESHANVVDLSIRYINKYGKPRSIYTDRGGVYKVNTHNENDDYITQYERSLNEIDIQLKHANSPEAKGRIERSFKTDQDRLVKEMHLRGITTIEQANTFLENEYLPRHNARFECLPKNPVDLHVPHHGKPLEDVFTIVAQRTVANDWTVRYRNKLLQIDSSRPAIVKPKDIITVHERLDGTLYLTIRSSIINFKEINYKPILKREGEKVVQDRVFKPGINHPWRHSSNNQKQDISTLLK